MDEENFPARSPTRDAVEREMDEAENLTGSSKPIPGRQPAVEDEDEDSG